MEVIQVTLEYDPWRVNPDDEGEKHSDIPDSSRESLRLLLLRTI